VIDLALGTPAIAESRWPLDTVANQHQFVVAYLGTPCPAWSDPQANVVYLSSMIDQLTVSENIDPRRVYVTGFSKSGYMAYFVGCDLSRKVAAVAIMSSAMVGQPCAVARPVSELTIIGTRDLIPVSGNARYPSVAATAAEWRGLDGCTAKAPQTLHLGPVGQTTWNPCADGSAVAYYILEGGQHVIPGSAGLAPSNPDAQFDAAAAVWAFFAGHRSGSLTIPSAQLESVGARPGGRQIVTTLSLDESAVVTESLSARGRRLGFKRASAAPGRHVLLYLTVPANARPGTVTVTIRIQDAYRRTVTMSRRIRLA
jgi:dienelactone hydrolase